MTTLERTAYPRFAQRLNQAQLDAYYTPSEAEYDLVARTTQGSPEQQLNFMLQLKTFQQLHYFPPLDAIPGYIVDHVRAALKITLEVMPGYLTRQTSYRHRRAICRHLDIQPYQSTTTDKLIREILLDAAQIMNDPADLLNVVIETLVRERHELPAFSTLDRLTNQVRAAVHKRLFRQIAARLTMTEQTRLDRLVTVEPDTQLSEWSILKKPTGYASVSHMREMEARLRQLSAILSTDPLLANLLPNKIIHLAAEARALDAYRLKEIRQHNPDRYYALLVCFVHEAKIQARDDLVEMFLKRVAKIHANAHDELEEIHQRQRATVERITDILAHIIHHASDIADDAHLGQEVRRLLEAAGGLAQLQDDCDDIIAYRGNNYLPLLYRHYKAYRALLFELARLLEPKSSSRDRSLVQALEFVLQRQQLTRQWWRGTLNLNFASPRWRRMIQSVQDGNPVLNRRALETCVFTYMAQELRSGDLYVPGSRDYADPRAQLLTWKTCEPLLEDYCQRLGFKSTATDFVDDLRQWLIQFAQEIDQTYPQNGQLYRNADGSFSLRRIKSIPKPPGTEDLEQALIDRLPERNLLDVLRNVQRWTEFTRHWGPLSGWVPSLTHPLMTYLATAFAYGSNLGPTQFAIHTQDQISARMLSYVNYQHVTPEKLDAALCDITNLYNRFDLPRYWGSGKVAIADGTLFALYENNLTAAYHPRYHDWGGIAYHFISDT